jgi:Leucine-rich repeat (LRR) protein
MKSSPCNEISMLDKDQFFSNVDVYRGSMSLSSTGLADFKKFPRRIEGDLICGKNKLTSLIGCPKEITGSFDLEDNQITSLEGCPEEIHGRYFCCRNNRLTSLKYGPKIVAGDYWCDNNILETLEGAPEIINRYFMCFHNNITTLKGAPKFVKTHFLCGFNNLTSLEGCPETSIRANFDNNKITDLHDIHRHMRQCKELRLLHNPITSHVLGLLKIENLERVYLDNTDVASIINKYLPLGDIFACQAELIEAGYEEYAKL